MADEKILEVLLKIRSDQADLNKLIGGLKDTKSATEEVAKSGFSLGDAFKFAGAEEVLRRMIDLLKQVPEQLLEGIKGGIEFKAQLQQVTVGIAGILEQTQGAKFIDFAAAEQAAGGVVDLLKEKANQIGLLYTDMFETFSHSQAALSNAGITNTQKQIDLLVLLTGAMRAFGLSGATIARDITDTLSGLAFRTIGGRQLAQVMGFADVTEMDKAIQQAKEGGMEFQLFTERLTGFRAAIAAASQNFQSETNRMKNSIIDLKGELATGLMEPLQNAMKQSEAIFGEVGAKAAARTWGQIFGEATKEITNFALSIVKTGDAMMGLSEEELRVKSLFTGIPVEQLSGGSLYDKNVAQLQIDALSKQRDLMVQVYAEAKTAKEQDEARALMGKVISQIQGEINQGKLKDIEYAKTILEFLLGMVSAEKEFLGVAEDAVRAHKELTAEVQKLLDMEALTRAKAFGTDDEISKAEWGLRYNAILEQRVKLNEKDAGAHLDVSSDTINELVYEQMLAIERAKEKKDQGDINALKREESALLKDNRLQQELINQNPNLTPDQKQALLIPLLIQERAELMKNLEAWKAYLEAQKGTDPQTLANIQTAIDKIRELGGQFDLLGFKMQKATSGVGGELKTWADSFGDSAHQIAGTIEGTINASLAATNQLLIEGAFRTGNWRQTVVGLEKSIASMFLTMLEKMALQQAMSLLHIGTTTTAQVTSGQAIAAAHAPAAAATSISSYGAAALIGEILAIAAIAAIMAALGGGFEEGGFTGGRRRKPVGIVHGEEFVFSSDEVDTLGVPFLQKLAAAAGGSYGGTSAGGGSFGSPGAGTSGGLQTRGGASLRRYHDGGMIGADQFFANPGWYGISQAREGGFNYYNPFANGGAGANYWSPVDYTVMPGGIDIPPANLDPGAGGIQPMVGAPWDQPGAVFTPIGDYYYVDNGDGTISMYSKSLDFIGTAPAGGDFSQAGAVNPTLGSDPFAGGGGGQGGGMFNPVAVADYWVATQQLGTYGVDWFYDANGNPKAYNPGAGGGQGGGYGGLLPGTAPPGGYAFGAYGGVGWAPWGQNFGDLISPNAVGQQQLAAYYNSGPGVILGNAFRAGPTHEEAGTLDKWGNPKFTISQADWEILNAHAGGAPGSIDPFGGMGPFFNPNTNFRGAGSRHSGGLLNDELYVIAQLGEFMMQRRSVDHYGVDFMRALNDRRVPLPVIGRRHSGGDVSSSDLVRSTVGVPTGPGGLMSADDLINAVAEKIEVHVHNSDLHDAVRRYDESPSARKIFRTSMSRNRI
jgi:hypothetical protein